MREVVENKLWIGHTGDLRDLRGLAEREIEAVVELAYDEAPATLPRSMIVCRFPLLDGEGNSPTILEAAINAVHRFLDQGVPVLVACGAGMSRSPGVTAMGIAKWKNIDANDALREVSHNGAIDLHPELWADLKRAGRSSVGLPKLDLIVIRSQNVSEAVQFYSQFGLNFVEERHGRGPIHFAANASGLVLEIYPAKSTAEVDDSTRLGFEVPHNWIRSTDSPEINDSTLVDPDGRKVQLTFRRFNSTNDTDQIGMDSLASAINAFRANKRLADKAIAQVSDEKLRIALDDGTNSIAVIMKHVAGNLRSRWTDFLTTDGEKPDRHRDSEFIDDFGSRDDILSFWENGWDCLFSTLESLSDSDLEKTVTIRGEPHSVSLAIARSLGHTCYHVGQIVLLARHHVGEDWNVLTIPRGKSEEFNQENWGQTGKSHS